MADTLAPILIAKRKLIAERRAQVPEEKLRTLASEAGPARGFAMALAARAASGRFALVTEIKKASPSAGLIRSDFDPARLALAYERGGAACLSVLTDQPFFQGSEEDLALARSAVTLPVLRKDFMIDPYQIWESRAIGADCVLLIIAVLTDDEARFLEETAIAAGLDVLVEIHDVVELQRALRLKTPLVGINNRNLKTLKTDFAVTEVLAKKMPKDRFVVSESGLKTRDDLRRMADAGARAFLVGESLMRDTDIEAATRALAGPAPAVPQKV
jgi:indole-3-glycerol phosphate synthase